MLSIYYILSLFIVGIYIASTFNQVFLFYFKKSRLHLLMVALGIVASLNLYNSLLLHETRNVQEFSALLKLNVAYYLVSMVLLVWILFIYCGKHFRWMFNAMVVFSLSIFVLNLALPHGVIFDTLINTISMEFVYHPNYRLPVGKINAFYPFLSAVYYLMFVVFLGANAKWMWSQKMARKVSVLLILLTFFTFVNIYDVLIDMNLIRSAYLTEFGMLPIILLFNFETAYELIRKEKVEKKLQEVSGNFNTLITKVQLLVVGVDLYGKINYSNPFFNKLVGFSEQDILGADFIDKFVPEFQKTETEKAYIEYMNGDGSDQYDIQLVTKDKELRYVAWSNVLLKNETNEVHGLLCIGADITERMHSRKKLTQAYKEIKAIKIQLEEENSYLKSSVQEFINQPTLLIGKSDAMQYLRRNIDEVAKTESTVLIEGETGVGKELVAQSLFEFSLRNKKPFVKVNCGALPKELIESELFGHEKGAFTGASQARKGRFELADGGTLFLDEIGELPLSLQPKLLRVLQSGEFEKLGSEKTSKVNVRIIAATNKDLRKCAQEGSFREDLYYRLSVFPITVPPLRQRKEDIEELVKYFIAKFCTNGDNNKKQVSMAVIKKLKEYSWPGNIRELMNVMERAVITSTGNKLVLRENLENTQSELDNVLWSLESIEKEHILKVLTECNWKISGSNGAAGILQLNESTLRSKMKKLGIEKPQKREFILN